MDWILAMKVIAPPQPLPLITARTSREVRLARRALDIELLGLIAASIVILFGIGLVYAAKVGRLEEAAAPAAVLSLDTLTSPSQLEPLLTMVDSPVERQTVALALYRRATTAPALDHVGALAEVTMPAATVRGDRRLEQLRARLDRRPEAREVPVLSRADVVSLKPRLAVRSVASSTAGSRWPSPHSSAPSGSRTCFAAGADGRTIRSCCRPSCCCAVSA